MGTAKRERQKANRAVKRAEEYKQDQRDRTKRRFVRIGLVVVLIVGAVIAIAVISDSGGDDTDEADSPANTATGDTANDETEGTASDQQASGEPVFHDFEYGDGECAPDEKPDDPRRPTSAEPFAFEDAPQQCIDPAVDYTATLATSEGDIVIDLDTEQVPGTVNNFVNLTNWGYYDDTKIFRGAQSIGIIQGGGNSNTDSPGYEIFDEGEGFTYEAGQLVMARSQSGAGAQWFINANDNASALNTDGSFVVFGTVTEGLDVVENILSLFPADDDMTAEREIALESVTVTEN